jgi:hypothetical protein
MSAWVRHLARSRRRGSLTNLLDIPGATLLVDPVNYRPAVEHDLMLSTRSGYYGDLTRTVVRGKANEAQRQLWCK